MEADLLALLGALAALATLPGTLYLAALTLAAWRRPPPHPALPDRRLRIAVVVPAHDEARGLPRTLASLRRATEGMRQVRVVVVADNCSDDTAAVARRCGVEVLERHDPQRRGKGYALAYAYERIADADWYVVVDADTDVEPGFVAAMRRAMTGADALQCRYLVRDARLSPRTLLTEVALAAWNVLRPRGRAALGLSAGLLGNGFALSRATLQRVPWRAGSIVEDCEYHLMLVRAGLRVRWVDDAVVRAEMPVAARATASQHARWEGGRLRLLLDQGSALLRELASGRWNRLDPLGDLLLAPLALHCGLLTLALAAGSAVVQGAAAAGLGLVALHVATGLFLIRAGSAHWQALLRAPLYMAWKWCQLGRLLRAAQPRAAWTRTERN